MWCNVPKRCVSEQGRGVCVRGSSDPATTRQNNSLSLLPGGTTTTTTTRTTTTPTPTPSTTPPRLPAAAD
ncbi:hypothetical protein COCVIDRAFT_106132 [Bipolaris victoriae FI3]|uniref:Uncharacterized protein n=1 Tax=Bipolaris victoriae (strain FI3) TaxID=930091 RepID=W7E8C3_BIPV3|nr:hypothetical protein COCVIDRAFT_106132 [Bipolaris victoriae FI3]